MVVDTATVVKRNPVTRIRLVPNSPDVGLFLRDSASGRIWASMAIRATDLVTSGYADGYESITYESDPNRSAAYRSANVILKQLRERRKALYKQISRSAYKEVVQKWTSPFPKLISVWDGTYWVSREWNIHWTSQSRYFKVLSKREYLEWCIRNRVSRDITRDQETIDYLRAHPESDVLEYRWFLSEPLPPGLASSTGDHVWHFLHPSMVRKEIPNRDWDRIRATWRGIRLRVQDQIDEVDEAIHKTLLERQKYELSTELPWNGMHASYNCEPCIPVSTDYTGPVFAGSVAGQRFEAWTEPGGVYLQTLYTRLPPLTHTFTRHTVNLCRTVRIGPKMPEGGFDMPVSQLEDWAEALLGHDWTDLDQYNSFAASCALPTLRVRYTQSVGVTERTVWNDTQRQSELWASGLSGQLDRAALPKRDAQSEQTPYVIDLDSRVFGGIEEEAARQRLLAVQRLLALDIKGDALEFNVARSVGELKDTKDTIQSGRDFWQYCRSARDKHYYQVVLASNPKMKPMVVAPESLLGSRITRLKASTAYPSKKALAKLGIVRLISKRVTALTTIAELASLYLAWKFGISQTIGDVDSVIRNGWRWAIAIRRGLSQLLTHLDTSRRYHTLRRMWRVAASVVPAGKKSVYTEDVPAHTSEVSFVDELSFWPIIAASENPAILDTLPLMGDDPYGRYLESTEGFRFLIYPNRVRENTKQAVKDFNTERLLEKFSNSGLGVPNTAIAIRNEINGVVFAKFSWRTLLKSLRGGLSTMHARCKTLLTAWELAPLSFVVEWCSNVRDLIQSAQALLERTEAKISPIGKPWEVIKSRLWYGILHAELAVDVKLEAVSSQYLLAFVKEQDSIGVNTSFVCGLHQVAEVVRVTYTLKRSVAAQAAIMKRSRIRKVVRRPFVGNIDELPSVKVRFNLNGGKLGSLLAMFTQNWK